MKYTAVFIAALLVGFVLGAWGPKTDLKKAKQELADLQKQQAKKARTPTSLTGISAIVPMPDKPAGRPRPPARRHAAPPDDAGPEPPVTAPEQPPAPTPPQPAPAAAAATNMTFQDRIKTAADLWRVRVDLARNSFLSNVKPDAKQADRFDVVMEAMNLRLADRIEKWVEVFKEEGEVRPEAGIRMMNDLSGIVVMTYDELDSNMPTNWRTAAGDGFQVLDFIDPEVALPLAQVDALAGTNAPGTRGFRIGGPRPGRGGH